MLVLVLKYKREDVTMKKTRFEFAAEYQSKISFSPLKCIFELFNSYQRLMNNGNTWYCKEMFKKSKIIDNITITPYP